MIKTNLKVACSLDCSWQLCPVPILMTEEKILDLKKGEVLEVVFTDPGAKPDLLAWCKSNGHEVLGFKEETKRKLAYIERR
jgi:tRNA 2-thiouridine synthesizing protein A